MIPHGAAPSVRASVRVYRLLLFAYPKAFRRAFGSRMRATFRDAALAAHATAGAAGILELWLHTLADFARSVVREQANTRPIQGPAHRFHTRRRFTMGAVMQDLRCAVRSLTRAPTFTTVAIVTLALGVGAVVSIFSIVDGVLLRPMPYPEPDRIVRIYGADRTDPSTLGNVSPVDVVDWREQATSFDAIATVTGSFLSLTGSGEPVMVWSNAVSASMFEVLRVTAARGRPFTADEEVEGRHRVTLLSHALWQSRYGGDPTAVGGTITLQGSPYEIIGILPEGFTDPFPGPFGDAGLWRPLSVDLGPGARGGHWLQAYARLSDGTTLAAAQVDLKEIMLRLEAQYPATNTNGTVRVVALHDAIAGSAKRPLIILLGAVGLLLLIACANVANLMLARSISRRRELAVRAALGAGRLRVARELFAESALIAFAASGLGLAIAWAITRAVPVLAADNLPRSGEVRIDVTVMAFTLAICALTAVLFGVGPVLRSARQDVQSDLRDGGRGATAGRSGSRMRGGLVVAEVALSVVLLVGAGLLVRSFQRLLSVDTGFDRTRVLTATLSLPRARFDAERGIAFFRDLEEQARSLPGVRQAGLTNMLPMSGRWSCDSFALEDRVPPPEGQEPCAETRTVSTGYFDAFGIGSIEGRTFTDADRDGTLPVAVIDHRLAARFWPDGGAVGQRVKWGWSAAETPWLTIVGVVGDVKHFGLDAEDQPTIYMPLGQRSASQMTLVAGTDGDPAATAAGLRAIVRSLDPELPLIRLETMEQVVGRSVAAPRFRTLLLTLFAGLALVLSLIGLYGLLAFTVAQRTHEFGIRMAVGARRADVSRMVLRQGVGFAAAGIGLGVPVALLATRALRGLLFAVPPTDILTFAAVITLLIGVSAVASWAPARRATRVDPMRALREE